MLGDELPPALAVYQGLLLFTGLAALGHLMLTQGGRSWLTADNRTRAWSVTALDFFFYFLILFFLVLTLQMVIHNIIPAGILETEQANAWRVIIFGTAFHGTCIFTWLSLRRIQPRNFQEPVNARPLPPGSAVITGLYTFLAVYPVIMLGSAAWIFILNQAGVSTDTQDVVQIVQNIDSISLFILIMLVAVVLAPISEEILFRAALYRFLKARTTRRLSLVVSSLLFAALHQNWLSFVPLFLLGLVLCMVYEKTGNLKAPILLHCIFNLNTLFIIFVSQFV